jgi:hypothetical protein
MKKIWCLFSIANAYDQPDNNLIAWWSEKPDINNLGNALDIRIDHCKSDVHLYEILDGQTVRMNDEALRLQSVEEGKSL